MSSLETRKLIEYVCQDCNALLMQVGKAGTSTCSEFCGAKNRPPLPKNVKTYNNSVVACSLTEARNDGNYFILSGEDGIWRKEKKIGRELKPGDDRKLEDSQRYATYSGGVYLFEKES